MIQATKIWIGAAEALSREVGPLGIRVHILVLGRFRTDILNPESKKGSSSPGSHSNFEDYNQVKKQLADVHEASRGAQPGDPLKAAALLVDIARLDNLTDEQRHNLPLRIPLGAEAVHIMRRKAHETLSLLEEWSAFSESADYPGAQDADVPSYNR